MTYANIQPSRPSGELAAPTTQQYALPAAPYSASSAEAVAPSDVFEPRGCVDQVEVVAAVAYYQQRNPLALGAVATGTDLALVARTLDADPAALANLKHYRLMTIRSVLYEALDAWPHVTEVHEVQHRVKDTASVKGKLNRRWADPDDQNPDRIVGDIYAFRVIVRDGVSEQRRWNLLQHVQAHFRSPDIALDGEPALRMGGWYGGKRNPFSVKGYGDQRAVFSHVVQGVRVPFEVQVFTQAGFEDYKRSHPSYQQNRKQASSGGSS